MFRRRRVAPAVSTPGAAPAPDGANSTALADLPPGAGEPLPAPVEARDDEALVRAAQAGDLEAFNLLVQRHERPVFNVALRLLRDVGLAEDATQDTFVRAWQNIGSFQTGSVRSWLYKIATNRSYDMLRASARRPAGSLEAEMVEIEPIWSAGGAGEESPDAHALRRELSIYLERALTALPDDQRMVVLLVDVQGLDYHEVATVMGIALGTVKSRLSRARAKIRQALADDAPARELFERYLRLEGENGGAPVGASRPPVTEPDDE
ncbi:MAG: sigma-70 family RNA polymerase sigma factor [Thermomicrobiales bacterium]|nr:sigma-70 family RNA polymerase sigma factor [Thermomicrobiales bacterium]